MRIILTVAALLAVTGMAGAQEKPASLSDQLKKAVVQEEADRNPQKAIESYQRILADFQEERNVAATALFRLAECYRKTGNGDQAIQAYQRVVREFLDQPALVESSRRQLVSTYHVATAGPATTEGADHGTRRGIGAARGDASADTRPAGLSRADRVRMQTLESQIGLVQQQIDAYMQRVAVGQAQKGGPEYFQLQERFIQLRGQLEELRASEADRQADQAEMTRRQIVDLQVEIRADEAKIAEYQAKYTNLSNNAQYNELLIQLQALKSRLSDLQSTKK